MKKPKIFISGPIPGLDSRSTERFENIADVLTLFGFEVVSPHLKSVSPDMSQNVYLVDVKLLLECDAIFVIKGWTDNDGSILECYIADSYNLRLFSYHTPLDLLTEYVSSFIETSLDKPNTK